MQRVRSSSLPLGISASLSLPLPPPPPALASYIILAPAFPADPPAAAAVVPRISRSHINHAAPLGRPRRAPEKRERERERERESRGPSGESSLSRERYRHTRVTLAVWRHSDESGGPRHVCAARTTRDALTCARRPRATFPWRDRSRIRLRPPRFVARSRARKTVAA